MPISRETVLRAAQSIAECDGLFMDADALLEDVVLLAYAFPHEDDFMAAIVNTCNAIAFVRAGKVDASELKYGFAGWSSYHYQHRVGQGVRATCRIMFRSVEGGIEVKGFGHRRIPEDFCFRMSEAGR